MIEFYEVATSKRSEPVRPAAGQGGKTKRAAGACEVGGGAGGYQLLSELISDWEMRGLGTSHDVA